MMLFYIRWILPKTNPEWLVKRMTRDFESETSSVNEAHNHAHFWEQFPNFMKTNNYTLYVIFVCLRIVVSNTYWLYE